MRRFLFDWHLTLGKFAGALILIWSASGALMTLDPVVRRAFDAEPPKIKGAPVEGARFTYPVSRLPVAGASAVALRSFSGRSWYEARWPDGRVAGFDAATGWSVPAEIAADEARERIAKALPSKWTVLGIDTLTANDDHYRPTDFPAYRLALAGPGAPVLYLSSRDGSVLKTTTRMSRGARWLGMGVHTWNPEALKRSFDTPRRWALASLVALPLFLLALISYALLYRRREDARVKVGASKRVAALVAVALIAGVPGPASAQAVVRVVMPKSGLSFAPPIVAPVLGASILPSAVLGIPSLSVIMPALAAPALVVPVSAAPVAASAFPAAARPLAARALVAVPAVPVPHASAVDTRRSLESQVSGARVVFDGIALKEEGAPFPAAAFTSRSSGLSAASIPERPSAPAAAKSTAPRGPDRKALWGIYLTHGAHLFTMSAAWRVAWPLLVIDLAGKASLAAIGSAAALVEMGTGLAAGMIVDRLLPRKSMAGAAVVRAVIAVALYTAASAGGAGFPLLFGAFLAHSFALTTIHIGQSSAAPAAAGDAPSALRRVNSILKIVTAAVSIPGSLLGGWAVASMGVPVALLTYAAANVLVLAPLYFWLMPNMAAAPAVPAAAPKPDSRRVPGLLEAAKLIFTSRILLGALIAMAAGVVLVEPLRSTTLPILASDLSPASAAMLLGSFQAAFYTGQFAGNFGLLKWGEKLSNSSWILLGAAGLLAFDLFALAPVHIAFAFAAATLIGLLTQPLSVVAKTAFQEEVRRLRPDLLGRAMGVNNLFYRLAVSAGTALIGWAAVSGAALALGATGTLAAVYGGVAVALVASTLWLMRRMGDKK